MFLHWKLTECLSNEFHIRLNDVDRNVKLWMAFVAVHVISGLGSMATFTNTERQMENTFFLEIFK